MKSETHPDGNSNLLSNGETVHLEKVAGELTKHHSAQKAAILVSIHTYIDIHMYV